VHRLRVRRLGRLAPAGLTPPTLSGLTGPLEITLTAVAQHLQVLEERGLARAGKIGRVRTCRTERVGFAAVESWIAHHRTLWDRSLDRRGEVMIEDEAN
jgi:predicted ArsR family transcriptional regulator